LGEKHLDFLGGKPTYLLIVFSKLRAFQFVLLGARISGYCRGFVGDVRFGGVPEAGAALRNALEISSALVNSLYLCCYLCFLLLLTLSSRDPTERLNYAYCSYANGLIAYVVEVAGRTEQHWCPIRHAHRVRHPHSRYSHFLPYGDAQTYRDDMEAVRTDFKDIKSPN
jgi:hypothetical protein